MNQATHTIEAYRESLVRARLADINKRAVKLGLPEITVSFGEPFWQRVAVAPGVDRRVWFMKATLTGSVPRVNGFALIASIEHTEAGNLILKAPCAHDRELPEWRNASAGCAHCGHDRARKSTFLVESDTGEILQIGRNCLADFVRSSDVESMLSWFAHVSSMFGGSDEESFGGSRWPDPTPAEYVATAIMAVRDHGFVKTTGAVDGQMSTKERCCFATGPEPTGSERLSAAYRAAQPGEPEIKQAEGMLAWLAATTESSDYMHSMRVAAGGQTVNERARGLLASLPACYARAMESVRLRSTRPVSTHYGAVGDRFDMEAEVVYSKGFDGMYGPGTMVMFRDNAGRIFQWFGTGEVNSIRDFSGRWFLRATIKRHETSRRTGEAITLLTRCSLQREPHAAVKAKRKRVAA